MARRIEFAPSWGKDPSREVRRTAGVGGPVSARLLPCCASRCMARPYPKRRSARVRGTLAPKRRAARPRGGHPPGRAVVARSEIRSRRGSGVGARATLLLLLLQGGTHACGLPSASWGALLGGHRGLLSFPGIFLGCQAPEPPGYVPQGWGGQVIRCGWRIARTIKTTKGA